MGEKDIAGKTLADYNDVFADIMNVFLFRGEQVISPNDLTPVRSRSQYKAGGTIHEQERDVAKTLKDHGTVISMIGLEQQVKPEKFMPVRLIGYDGQSYRSQLLKKNAAHIFPVITIVLYFGQKHWNYGRSLRKVIDIPNRLRPFVSDYRMENLFEVAFMDPEDVKLFRSDFRYVADYFVQMRRTNDYRPSPEAIRHVDETLKLMHVLTGDSLFEEAANAFSHGEREVSMESAFSRQVAEGRKEGWERGMLQGEVNVYYNVLNYSPEKIARETNQPVDVIYRVIQDMNLKKN